MSATVLLPDAPARRAILVVEDDALIRFATADLLRDDGYLVLEAATADEALVLLAAGARVDAIFSDVQMPGELDGVDLAHRVAERYPLTPVVLTSANDVDHRVRAEMRFLRKPYRDADVVAALRAELDGGAPTQEKGQPDEEPGGEDGGPGGGRRGSRP